VAQQDDRETAPPARTAGPAQRGPTHLRQRNRLLGLMLAIVAAVVLVVAVTLTVMVHNAETGHALASF
jgi:hypothetical protein